MSSACAGRGGAFGAGTGLAAGLIFVVAASLLAWSAECGNVKPATVFLSCEASSENLDTEAAVAAVALPV